MGQEQEWGRASSRTLDTTPETGQGEGLFRVDCGPQRSQRWSTRNARTGRPTISPDEELNEQVLQNMRDGGDDLSAVRPVHFQLVFPTWQDARQFAEAAMANGLLAEVSDGADGPVLGMPWDVNVTIELRPELASVSGHERDLGEMAFAHNGRGDGWFCERISQRET
ncbi:MAG: ribonuclease E inhibitor RraB [bacterium]|nr:ribonuclease E inhibitor RraB [bacterium]